MDEAGEGLGGAAFGRFDTGPKCLASSHAQAAFISSNLSDHPPVSRAAKANAFNASGSSPSPADAGLQPPDRTPNGAAPALSAAPGC